MDETTHDSDLEARRAALEAERRAVCEELRHYPPQVAGCDLHWKDLAERRARLSAELARLDAAAGGDEGAAQPSSR